MTVEINYNKPLVIQALRYHFVYKKELRIMIILVNVFAILSLVLFLMHKITPVAFLLNALLWIGLMISIWFILPNVVYRRNETFRNQFTMDFDEESFTLKHNMGRRIWAYTTLQNFKETPHFFLLYFDDRTFFLVPKDGFKKIDDIINLRNRLKEKVKR
jgi:hypothetical protein